MLSESRRRGFALVAALLAIVCAGALLAGLAFAARQEYLLSSAARDSQRAFAAAELAAWSAAAVADSGTLALPLWLEYPTTISEAAADTVHAAITRLSDSTFVVLGEAGVRGAGEALLWRRVALFTRAETDSSGAISLVPLPGRSWAELP